MLVTCQRFGDLFLFGLVWQYSLVQTKYNSHGYLLTCSSNITLSLPSYTGSALKKELNCCNVYLSLLYVWQCSFKQQIAILLCSVWDPARDVTKMHLIYGWNFILFRNVLLTISLDPFLAIFDSTDWLIVSIFWRFFFFLNNFSDWTRLPTLSRLCQRWPRK